MLNAQAPRYSFLDESNDDSTVIFTAASDINVIPGNTASFILHVNTKLEAATTIYTGTVVTLEFESRGEIRPDEKPINDVTIHGTKFAYDKELREVHEAGKQALISSENAAGRIVIVGGESFSKPNVFVVSGYIVTDLKELGRRIPKGETGGFSYDGIVRGCNAILGSNKLRAVTLPSGEPAIRIPGRYLLQDLTVIERQVRRDVKTATPRIMKPVCFPTLGSLLTLSEGKGAQRIVTVVDTMLDIGGLRSLVTVRSVDKTGNSRIERLGYGNLYMEQPKDGSQLPPFAWRNPSIVNVVEPSEVPDLFENHLDRARAVIGGRLNKWCIYGVFPDAEGRTPFTVLADFKPTTSKNKKKEHDSQKKFVSYEKAFGDMDRNITSFVTGEVTLLDGTVLKVYNSENNQSLASIRDLAEEDVFEIREELPEGARFSSLIFNAVGGGVKLIYGNPIASMGRLWPGKRDDASIASSVFFSTNNGYEVGVSPFFERTEMPDGRRSTVDVVNDTRFFAQLGFSLDKAHPNQIVPYWTRISPAFEAFYIWVTTQGSAKKFKTADGKALPAAVLRKMFEDEESPHLVECFNFLLDGLTEKNPTRNSGYTRNLVQSIYGVEFERVYNSVNNIKLN